MQTKKLGIVSLGLIGGSLLKSLSKFYSDIAVVTRNKDTIEKAKNYTQNASDNFDILRDCEVVFVCSPMNKTLEILDKLESVVNKSTIVADVCSLKEFVMQKQRPYVFIGSHPMAGTENSGFDSSFENLFDGAKWVLTPSKNTEKTDIDVLISIIEKTGAQTLLMDEKRHDEAVALISHMPMILSQALMKSAMGNISALKLAASGFRDMTRLSLSNTEMAEDMMKMNSSNIFNSLLSVIEEARSLFSEDYKSKIEEVKEYRSGMYNSDGKNIL